jgi:hypothetical protein
MISANCSNALPERLSRIWNLFHFPYSGKRSDKMDNNTAHSRILTTENGLKSRRLNPNGVYKE